MMQEATRVQLPSPRRLWRSPHKLAETSPARPFEGPANQTGYDSDDEGEPGDTEDVEELEDSPEPLPPPLALPQVLSRTSEASSYCKACISRTHSLLVILESPGDCPGILGKPSIETDLHADWVQSALACM